LADARCLRLSQDGARKPPPEQRIAMEVAALIAAGLTVLTVALYGVFSDD
jgi:hypothetical protein